MGVLRVKSLVEAVAYIREHHPEVASLVAMPFDEVGANVFASDIGGMPVGEPLVIVDTKEFVKEQ